VSKSVLQQAVDAAGAEAVFNALTPEQRAELQYIWPAWARPEQLPPLTTRDGKPWLYWLLLAGRGFGKSRTGAEWARQKAKDIPGSHGALIGPTAADTRDVMVKALIACSPAHEGLVYEPSKRRLAWSNGSSATLYSAEEPDRLRGPQHHWAWADELAAWQYADEVWDMLMMTLRLGERPQVVASTTPRPIAIVRRLLKDPGTIDTRGSTFDNAANLSSVFIQAVKDRYDGTRLGRQELYAEVLEDVDGALWTHEMIERSRVKAAPPLRRIVVGVDPSGSAKKEADETGIVIAGVGDCNCLGDVEQHGFVLQDKSGRYSPADMGKTAIDAYRTWEADRIVAEDNFGGQIIDDLIHLIDPNVPYRAVHASKGKIVRAEPIAALYERGRVHHVGMHAKMEDEICTYTPQEPKSPGRMDALVWALTDLMMGETNATFGSEEWTPPRRTF
jgi:phage terminase large subunit-like protein